MIDATSQAYSYFPGCSLTATNRAYDISTRRVAEALGLGLVELEDWNCCGATAYLPIREKRSFVLSARNLAIAEKEGLELATVCNACYVVLRKVNKYMSEDRQLSKEVRGALKVGGMDYRGTVRVRHFLDIVVNDVGRERVKSHVEHDLSGLKVAGYCGCQLTRPFDDIDHAEYPRILDRLIGWLGAEAVPFPVATKCCGGMIMTTNAETGRALTGKILKVARDRGADCVATCCPLCQMNLEAYQERVTEAVGADCHIPVLYFTQLMGSAFGLDPKKLALRDSLTPVEEVLTEKVGNR
ncbi:MAG: CoB--CoM heterodisulfide reductase iron-sulfur subunit B family protein [Planctomycetota bacterium]